MKKQFIYILVAISSVVLFSCSNDEKIDSNSIFETSQKERNELDKWLGENYINPYNVRVIYKYEDIETSFSYTLAPARVENAKKMSIIMKHLWLGLYDEVAGTEFTQKNSPRIIQLVGSSAYDAIGQGVLGTAEGGMKVNLYDINSLDYSNIQSIKERYFKTIHHEFAHILHQTKLFDPDYEKINEGEYVEGDWYKTEYKENSLSLGFISAYSRKNPNEDFVESYSHYLLYGPVYWDAQVKKAGAIGGAKLNKKLEIIRKYMSESWGFSLDYAHEVMQRRSAEMDLFDLDSLY